MSEEAVNDLIVFFSAGLGMMLTGGVTLLLARRTALTRLAAGGSVAALSGLLPIALGNPVLAAKAVGLTVASLVAIFALTSPAITRVASSAFGFVRRPAGRAGFLAVGGVGLMVVSLTRFTAEEDAALDRDDAALSEFAARPNLLLVEGLALTTDQGTAVPARVPEVVRPADEVVATDRRVLAEIGYAEKVIRTGPATDASNCHGWVFTAGRCWVSGEDVDRILAENGYRQVSNPLPGDLVVYRDHAGLVAHSAIVRSVGSGEPLVEGKWGWMGVFLHPIKSSSYGTHFAYYRSARGGHLLAGAGEPLGESAPPVNARPAVGN